MTPSPVPQAVRRPVRLRGGHHSSGPVGHTVAVFPPAEMSSDGASSGPLLLVTAPIRGMRMLLPSGDPALWESVCRLVGVGTNKRWLGPTRRRRDAHPRPAVRKSFRLVERGSLAVAGGPLAAICSTTRPGSLFTPFVWLCSPRLSTLGRVAVRGAEMGPEQHRHARARRDEGLAPAEQNAVLRLQRAVGNASRFSDARPTTASAAAAPRWRALCGESGGAGRLHKSAPPGLRNPGCGHARGAAGAGRRSRLVPLSIRTHRT